jgi:uncharacterized membrane protein YqjE
MAVPTTSGEHPPEKEGLIDHLRALAASVAAYLGARLQLAGMESREAAGHYLKILVLLIAAFFAFVFGYIFLCLAGVFILQHFLKWSWTWIMLGLAGVHFAVAVIAILLVKSKFPKAVFAATIAEFKKDQTWLNTPRTTTKPN